MDNAKICIREMKDGEQKEIKQVGRRSFPLFEALFVSTPEKAMVAECGGRIIGSILYKPFHAKNKSAVYIDETFVAPGSRGTGTGKRLYQETFEHLRAQGHEVMTALVKDDNVGSWKLFLDNGFKRAGPREVIRQIGIAGLIWQCIKTPWPVSYTHLDVYKRQVCRNARIVCTNVRFCGLNSVTKKQAVV